MHHPFQQWLTTLPDHALIPTHSGLLTEAAHGVIAVEDERRTR